MQRFASGQLHGQDSKRPSAINPQTLMLGHPGALPGPSQHLQVSAACILHLTGEAPRHSLFRVSTPSWQWSVTVSGRILPVPCFKLSDASVLQRSSVQVSARARYAERRTSRPSRTLGSRAKNRPDVVLAASSLKIPVKVLHKSGQHGWVLDLVLLRIPAAV